MLNNPRVRIPYLIPCSWTPARLRTWGETQSLAIFCLSRAFVAPTSVYSLRYWSGGWGGRSGFGFGGRAVLTFIWSCTGVQWSLSIQHLTISSPSISHQMTRSSSIQTSPAVHWGCEAHRHLSRWLRYAFHRGSPFLAPGPPTGTPATERRKDPDDGKFYSFWAHLRCGASRMVKMYDGEPPWWWLKEGFMMVICGEWWSYYDG